MPEKLLYIIIITRNNKLLNNNSQILYRNKLIGIAAFIIKQ